MGKKRDEFKDSVYDVANVAEDFLYIRRIRALFYQLDCCNNLDEYNKCFDKMAECAAEDMSRFKAMLDAYYDAMFDKLAQKVTELKKLKVI